MTPPSNELKQILGEIEERAEAASVGPWRFVRHWGPHNWRGAILHDTEGAGNITVLPLETCTPERDANGSFIAFARTDVPALVKALRRAMEFLSWELHDDPGLEEIQKGEITAILDQGREDKKP